MRLRWLVASLAVLVAVAGLVVTDRVGVPDVLRRATCLDGAATLDPTPTSAEPSQAETSETGTSEAGTSEIGTSGGQPELRPASEWGARFARSWRGERGQAEALSRSTDSWDHYTLAYSLDALTAAYLAGGPRDYVDQAMSLTEQVVAGARASTGLDRSQYRDGYVGWASGREGGQEVALFESYFWRYATRMLRVVDETAALRTDPALAARSQRLVEFAEQQVFAKWYSRGADQTIYRSRTHMAAHWAYIALNLSAITTDPGRRARYQEVVSAVDDGLPNYPSSLRRQMVAGPLDPQAAFWSDVWGSCSRPGQDVAHGNGVIAYVVEAHDAGSTWTAQEMTRLVRLLDVVIWPRSGPGSQFVDGSGVGTGWYSDGFVKLGRYDPALQRRLEDHQPANAQFYANGALNAALLTCAYRSEPLSPPGRCV